MKKNTLLIIFVTLLIISLGGLTLFFGYKYFTVDNKCEYDTPTKEENKEVKNMTDSEILGYIGKQTYKYNRDNVNLDNCIIEADVITLNGVLSSTNEAQDFNYNLFNHVINLAGNSFSIKYDKENYECKFNIIYEYAVVNGVIAVKVSQKSDFGSYPWKWYHFYDVKNDEIIEMGDAMRLMGVTDLGGAKSYEDLNNDCSDLRITNHNKVTINKYVAECA